MAEQMKLDCLAIAAHPDDVEITSGGLLINLSDSNRKVGILDLTRGEMGTFGDQNDRNVEAIGAGEIMGLTYRNNLSMPDAAVEYNQENKLRIAQIIRNTQPELVILPHWVQRHPDHLACSRLGFDACFLSGLKKIELDGEPFRPRKIIYASYSRTSQVSFVVDISESFKRKCEAVSAYKSQFDNPENSNAVFSPGVDIYDYMAAKAKYFGQMVGVEYAEGYIIKEQILIDDPLKMPVSSI